jgi:serine/threonine protein kinase
VETPDVLYLVMEYADGGELFDFIVARKRLNDIDACRFY